MVRFIGGGLESNFMTATLHQTLLKLTGIHRAHKNRDCQGRPWIKSTTAGDCLNVIDVVGICVDFNPNSCWLVIGAKRDSQGRVFHHPT